MMPGGKKMYKDAWRVSGEWHRQGQSAGVRGLVDEEKQQVLWLVVQAPPPTSGFWRRTGMADHTLVYNLFNYSDMLLAQRVRSGNYLKELELIDEYFKLLGKFVVSALKNFVESWVYTFKTPEDSAWTAGSWTCHVRSATWNPNRGCPLLFKAREFRGRREKYEMFFIRASKLYTSAS